MRDTGYKSKVWASHCVCKSVCTSHGTYKSEGSPTNVWPSWGQRRNVIVPW